MLFFCLVCSFAMICHILADKDLGPVTCGSAVKLINKETGFLLHSHTVAWGSGSGQQSVTTTGVVSDANSLWIVKEKFKENACQAGEPIKCGDTIRLEHMSTGRNLHSHLFKSALSGNQEVSGFGEEGFGDTGDNWKLICETNGKYWERGNPVVFQHIDTGKYLYTAKNVA